MLRYEMQAGIWVYPGKGGWHFITLPSDVAARIKAAMAGLARPWGSLGVTAVIGETRWQTSLFPDKTTGSLLLPVKASVRQRESLKAGDEPTLTIEIVL
ncbi:MULTISPECIES: DUF1905 domain-containing protein [unclassified Mesorhizobium]|jgi:hypothetical protein|uniref:DUF1905 domain-containing protein n=1 Tax=unclassified Mesorhizobium TaxID=325217 RepID=UPI000FE3B1B6|nr:MULTISPECIES: DUF1905 domain-containing protein [unclassified Mesorhizobium]MDG4896271.1 DUF1905 domain-containing protein [Mesorhizobium sp. WSM4976]RWH71488.1 MAG: DUF1905 domain-containing protein [Mesorhizobium sp.]RWL30349.1 MAG: DUF1905 domain-containing protein [Mesorhizobium sp.]RWL32610.1 MAG: DUF1905 domain-containing protein [Mesorhizobium sp.]RWL39324.1 MAG: DUF1905 domain-containing protein [Mesorhizobium sp.]